MNIGTRLQHKDVCIVLLQYFFLPKQRYVLFEVGESGTGVVPGHGTTLSLVSVAIMNTYCLKSEICIFP